MKLKLIAASGILVLSACSTPSYKDQLAPPLRAPASVADCNEFNGRSADAKMNSIYSQHLYSASQEMAPQQQDTFLQEALSEKLDSPAFVGTFLGTSHERIQFAADALKATTRFLVPNFFQSEKKGYLSLQPTFKNFCDFFPEREVKKVHALGTMAKAHLNLYPKLRKLGPNGESLGEVASPWTGLFDPSRNEGGVPAVLRFSIANPVAHTIEAGGKSLALEFIPGLGIKFLVDGRKSVDLVAMESLAGQGTDHNYFKYEFSPDFSRHAPPDFMTSTGREKDEMLARYAHNPVNSHVMGLVGKRFAQVIPYVMNISADELDSHSQRGPHPFVISIERMAQFDKRGAVVDAAAQKRPWRLVFKPLLENVDQTRLSQVTDSSQYVPGKLNTDFRTKLAHLRSGDRIYSVIGENEDGSRFALGELVLDSTPIPSEFADRDYFIQHALDTGRTPANAHTIASPN